MTGVVVIFGIVSFIVGGTWLAVRPFFQDEVRGLPARRFASSAAPPAITWIPLRPGWSYLTVSQCDALSGEEFEHVCAALFTQLRGAVQRTPRSGDFGADLLCTDSLGQTWAVQIKRWTDHVGVHAVQEVIAARSYYDTEGAMVVTTSYFTEAARVLAQRTAVQLIDRDAFRQLLQGVQTPVDPFADTLIPRASLTTWIEEATHATSEPPSVVMAQWDPVLGPPPDYGADQALIVRGDPPTPATSAHLTVGLYAILRVEDYWRLLLVVHNHATVRVSVRSSAVAVLDSQGFQQPCTYQVETDAWVQDLDLYPDASGRWGLWCPAAPQGHPVRLYWSLSVWHEDGGWAEDSGVLEIPVS